MMKKKSGFTLVELSITVLIVSAISMALIMVLRSNLSTMNWGQRRMNFNHKMMMAVRRVFYDIKLINPNLKPSLSSGYALSGEDFGDPRPKMVFVKKRENLNDELVFVLSHVNDVEMLYEYKFYVKDKKLLRAIKDLAGKVTIDTIMENVIEFRADNDETDVKQLYVNFTATDPDNNNRPEKVEFAVRLETDFVCVKKTENEIIDEP